MNSSIIDIIEWIFWEEKNITWKRRSKLDKLTWAVKTRYKWSPINIEILNGW